MYTVKINNFYRFSERYVPTEDSLDVTISSASEENYGIDYEITYTSYEYTSNTGGCLIATATFGSKLAPFK